jgi:hypothetical protein
MDGNQAAPGRNMVKEHKQGDADFPSHIPGNRAENAKDNRCGYVFLHRGSRKPYWPGSSVQMDSPKERPCEWPQSRIMNPMILIIL